jgi:glycosyltransferase involved in cell wall biosynthesis
LESGTGYVTCDAIVLKDSNQKSPIATKSSIAKRVRILLLIPHLGGGGAEQVTALLARGLSPEKYELHLELITQARADGAALPPWVKVHTLGASRVRAGAIRLVRLVRRLRPEVILSGMAHLNFLVLLLRLFFPSSTRVLVRQNGTISAALAHGGLPRYTRLLYRLLYRNADRVICQSRAMAADMAGLIQIGSEQIAVLPNPVDMDGIREGI